MSGMDNFRKIRVLSKISTLKWQSPEQKNVISLKIQAAETKVLIEKLQAEILQICSTKRNPKSTAIVKVMDKYSEHTVPLSLVSHSSSMVRRLGAVLIALIFEYKSDLFQFRMLNNTKNMCLSRNQLFLTNMSPAIKNSRPEPLYHVKKALFYYLPNSTFPKGLPCYLDENKLTNVFIEGQFLRLPDPVEQTVWMQFEELTSEDPLPDSLLLTNRLEELSSSSSSQSLSSNSEQQKQPNPVPNPYQIQQNARRMQLNLTDPKTRSFVGAKNPTLARLETLEVQGRADSLIGSSDLLKATFESMEQLDDKLVAKQNVHRVKCFQFFRKQKKTKPVGSSETMDSEQFMEGPKESPELRRSTELCGDHSSSQVEGKPFDVRVALELPPQFESVNDWATDKDYAYFKSQMRYVPITPSTKQSHSFTHHHATAEPATLGFSQQLEKRQYNLHIKNLVSDLLKQEDQKSLSAIDTPMGSSKVIRVENKSERAPTPQKLSIKRDIGTARKQTDVLQFGTKKTNEGTDLPSQVVKAPLRGITGNLARSHSPFRITYKTGSSQELQVGRHQQLTANPLPRMQNTVRKPPRTKP